MPQGLLVKGAKAAWRTTWLTFMRELAPQAPDGSYQRPTYGFRGQVGEPGLPAESGRYHLYVGNACPWCHRVLLALALRGLGQHIRCARRRAGSDLRPPSQVGTLPVARDCPCLQLHARRRRPRASIARWVGV